MGTAGFGEQSRDAPSSKLGSQLHPCNSTPEHLASTPAGCYSGTPRAALRGAERQRNAGAAGAERAKAADPLDAAFLLFLAQQLVFPVLEPKQDPRPIHRPGLSPGTLI